MKGSVPFQNILVWNLKSTLRWQYFLYPVLAFCFIGWSSSLYVNRLLLDIEKNVWDGVFISFAGPGVWSTSIVEMFRWFVPYLLFFYLVGDLAEGELSLRGYAIIPAIGSRLHWWLGKVITLFIFAIGYSLFGVCVVILSAALILPWNTQLSPFLLELWQDTEVLSISQLIAWITILVSNTLFAVALLQITVSIWLRKPFYAFAFVSTVMVLSWLAGIESPNIVRWLPGSQSMLLRHTEFDSSVLNFPLAWSVIYNLVVTLLVFLGSIRYMLFLDISIPKTDIRMEEKR